MNALLLGAIVLAMVPRLGGDDRLQRVEPVAAGMAAGLAAFVGAGLAAGLAGGAASACGRPSPQARAKATATNRARVLGSDLVLVPIVLFVLQSYEKGTPGPGASERRRFLGAEVQGGVPPSMSSLKFPSDSECYYPEAGIPCQACPCEPPASASSSRPTIGRTSCPRPWRASSARRRATSRESSSTTARRTGRPRPSRRSGRAIRGSSISLCRARGTWPGYGTPGSPGRAAS